MTILYFLGDSITYGAWDTKGGWVERLRDYYDKKAVNDRDYFMMFYNLGVSGDNSVSLLERLEREVTPRLKLLEKEEKVIVIEIGGNDAVFRPSMNSNWVSKQEFEQNVKKLVEVSKLLAGTIALIGIGVIDENNKIFLEYEPDFVFSEAAFREYDEILKRTAKQLGIHYINISKKLAKHNLKEVLDDGVHFNSKGHAIVFRTVKSYMVRKGMIKYKG